MTVKDSHSPIDVIECTAEVRIPFYDDPLDEDTAYDASVHTTRRGLCRLTLLAAEVGARFERDGEMIEPMTWILAPRNLFNGKAAIDACLQRDHFLRALLLHGLAMGLDAHPADLDVLLEDEVSRPSPQDGLRASGQGDLSI